MVGFCEDCGKPAAGRYDIVYLKLTGEPESITKGRALCSTCAKNRKVA